MYAQEDTPIVYDNEINLAEANFGFKSLKKKLKKAADVAEKDLETISEMSGNTSNMIGDVTDAVAQAKEEVNAAEETVVEAEHQAEDTVHDAVDTAVAEEQKL